MSTAKESSVAWGRLSNNHSGLKEEEEEGGGFFGLSENHWMPTNRYPPVAQSLGSFPGITFSDFAVAFG